MTGKTGVEPMSDRRIEAPQTVVISRRVKPGNEDAFEKLSTEMTLAAMEFPGHLGAHMFRPASVDDPEYRIIFKFATEAELEDWVSSDVRKMYIEQIEPLLLEPSQIEKLNTLVTWFSLPGRTPVKPPPRYKMAIVSWVALFPIVTAIFWLFEPWLVLIPLIPRVAMVTAVVMVLMTWVAMPRLTRLFAGWLYPKSESNLR